MQKYMPSDYTYEVAWSPVDEVYIARVVDFPSLAAHGDSMDEALAEARVAVEGGIELCIERGLPIPVPRSANRYSGKILLRITADLHRALALEADASGVSLNQHLATILRSRASPATALPQKRVPRAAAHKKKRARPKSAARKRSHGAG